MAQTYSICNLNLYNITNGLYVWHFVHFASVEYVFYIYWNQICNLKSDVLFNCLTFPTSVIWNLPHYFQHPIVNTQPIPKAAFRMKSVDTTQLIHMAFFWKKVLNLCIRKSCMICGPGIISVCFKSLMVMNISY